MNIHVLRGQNSYFSPVYIHAIQQLEELWTCGQL